MGETRTTGERNGEAPARTLLVFAHRDEAAAFGDVPHLVTGVGKINAAGALAQALAQGLPVAARAASNPALAAVGAAPRGAEIAADPDGTTLASGAALTPVAGDADDREPGRAAFARVVVLGTAGLIVDGPHAPTLDTVCQVTAALQHDFSLPSPVLAPGGEVILPSHRTATVATGDLFVQDDAQRERIAALGATLVDMEAYAYVGVCARFGVPLQVFKIPSDFANSATTDEEWDAIALRKSEQLRAFCAEHLPEVLAAGR